MFIFQKFEFFWKDILEPLRSHFAKSKYFEIFKLNRNLQRIPFKMMFSNELTVGSALNHLHFLFCKSVYTIIQNKRRRWLGAPPLIIFERKNLPQQTVYHWKINLTENRFHFKYRKRYFDFAIL